MKKFLAVMLALSFFVPASFGQKEEIRPAAIGVSFFLNDFTTADRIRSTSLTRVLRDKQWAKTKQMSPGLAIHYFKGVTRKIDFAGTLAGSFVKYPVTGLSEFGSDRFLLEADGAMNFKLTSEKYWVQPYLLGGIGAQMYAGKYFNAFLPLGAGIKVNFFDDAHLFTTFQYRIPVTRENNAYRFFYSIGIAGRIAEKPKPEVKPLPPPPPPPPPPPAPADTDKDGINDPEDKCPTVPGLARYQGCPIPDTDKDGINDEEDKCPTEPGPASNQGCPLVDTDKDGINDPDDKCPDLFGTVENQGCPEIKQEIMKKIDYAAQNIYFSTGKSTLLSQSFKGLDDVAKVMKENPGTVLAIDGHTDNVGNDATNQTLSENRAKAVKAYLMKRGVEEDRLKATGYGESQPIADNKTATGRQKNRRVEMKLSY